MKHLTNILAIFGALFTKRSSSSDTESTFVLGSWASSPSSIGRYAPPSLDSSSEYSSSPGESSGAPLLPE